MSDEMQLQNQLIQIAAMLTVAQQKAQAIREEVMGALRSLSCLDYTHAWNEDVGNAQDRLNHILRMLDVMDVTAVIQNHDTTC